MGTTFSRFRKDVGGIIWLAAGLFIGLALLSFHPEDPSFNSTSYRTDVLNYCGYAGSFLADLLFQFFGITAWIFPLGCARLSLAVFTNKDASFKRSRIIINVFLILTLSSLLALYFPTTKLYLDQISVGGAVGSIFAKALVSVFNRIGVGILLWSTTLVLVILYTERSMSEIFKLPLKFVDKMIVISLLKFKEIGKREVKETKSAEPKILTSQFEEPDDEKAFVNDDESEDEVIEEAPLKVNFTLSERKDGKSRKQIAKTQKAMQRIENWQLPKLDLLNDPPAEERIVDEKLIRKNSKILEDKMAQFSVNGKIVAVRPGPAVTMFEFKPNADIKISRITELADDLSLALSSESLRIIAPLVGRDVVGIEASNPKQETVYLKELLEDADFWDEKVKLPLPLGKLANGLPHIVDLRKIPHLLVAGTTGSGKSVFITSILTGLLFRHSPKTLRLILIDPKQVDLAAFHKVPHLILPAIKESRKAVVALKWTIKEMEKRYRSMSRFGARSLEDFNEITKKFTKDQIDEHFVQNEALINSNKQFETYHYSELPYIVIVVEEFGDLMAVDKAGVEQVVVRLAQMARACGIHLVLAMQSPRRDVVTGLIKTNIPGRISFKVASKLDSRIILDEPGGERLLARGDMLYLAPGVSKPERHHGAWIPESEIQSVAAFWSEQSEPLIEESASQMLEGNGNSSDSYGAAGENGDDFEKDERYMEILTYVTQHKEVSASLLQRKFRLGYPRAARLIEIFEKDGVVGPAQGSKPRQVLLHK